MLDTWSQQGYAYIRGYAQFDTTLHKTNSDIRSLTVLFATGRIEYNDAGETTGKVHRFVQFRINSSNEQHSSFLFMWHGLLNNNHVNLFE